MPSGPESLGHRVGSRNPNGVVTMYLEQHIPEYVELTKLRKQGWDNPVADDHFKRERRQADHPDGKGKDNFYQMTCRIGDELNRVTGGALSFNLPAPRTLAVLDLCMAPGGFTTAALAHNTRVSVRGISLPMAMGGYEVRIPNWQADPRITIRFLDITMLVGEMGVDVDAEIPASHPDAGRFVSERPFEGEQFDLAFCGGTVLRGHERPEYREGCEATRLLTSQLVLALGRLHPGGTLVVVMHRADAWASVCLMQLFSKFAQIKLFKPTTGHIKKSSFYMVARNVQSQSPEAVEAIEKWKGQWREATLGSVVVTGPEGDGESGQVPATHGSDSVAESLLADFGEQLVRLTKPVFKIQAKALRTAPWVQSGSRPLWRGGGHNQPPQHNTTPSSRA
ncbi:hypothetical protein GE09DRAFT_629409 [Coniochaeta sp. 2T2.1]|nr:hypothetical protein GE09DRAFT_629409 [Coniochaeta sp. 2T2.1]